MVTASAFDEDQQLAMTSGVDGFLRKPFLEEELLREIQRLCPAVVFRYEDQEETASAPPDEGWQAEVGALDAGLAAELVKLIECGDIFSFKNVVEQQLQVHAPLLGAHLQKLAERFEYEHILAILK